VSVLEKVRRWIDGDTAETVLEQAARDAQVKPRSEAEAFIVKIAREIETVMHREMVPLPQGTAIIPCEYIIFLSEEDDRQWQGIKRRGLEQGLYHILSERAREIAGKRKLETKSFVLELRIDGTLGQGSVRVQHSWEDSTGSKTGILARKSTPNSEGKSKEEADKSLPQSILPNQTTTQGSPLPAPDFLSVKEQDQTGAFTTSKQPEQVKPFIKSDDDEIATTVRPRAIELYRLEIWQGGVRQNVVPIYNAEISIGRGSKSKPVDIKLPGDPEISRRHVTLVRDPNGIFWIINEGKNPAMIGTSELPIGKRVQLMPGTAVTIGRYLIRIQPKLNGN